MRIVLAVVLVVAIGAAGAALADTAKARKPAWDVLRVPRTTGLLGPDGLVKARVAFVEDEDADVGLVTIFSTDPDETKELHKTRMAIGESGLWIDGIGNWYRGDKHGAPLIARDRGPFFDRKTGLSVTVDDDETTCAAWSDPAPECETDCYWVVCWAPDRGVVRLGGALAPGGHEYVGPQDACVDRDLEPELVALAANERSVTLCAYDSASDLLRTRTPVCRRLDRTTLRWKWTDEDEVDVSSLLATAPTTVVDRDEIVTICDDDTRDCPAVVLPTEARFHHAAANAKGTLAAALYFDRDDTAVLAAYDLGKGSRITSVALDAAGLGATLRFAGDVVVVEHVDRTELRRARTLERIGDVGGDSPIVTATPPVQVKGSMWAFATTAEVVYQDLKSGKVKRRVALPDPPRASGARAWLTRAGDDLIVVYSPLLDADDRGGIVTIDKSGVVTSTASPGRCY